MKKLNVRMSGDMIFISGEDSSVNSESSTSLFEKSEGNSDCGEPFVGQRLLLDFAPNEDIDNEYNKTKCCEFWDFINSQPEFKSKTSFKSFSDGVESIENIIKQKSNTPIVKEKTALSVLKFVEEKGIINPAFESKLPTLCCKEELNDFTNYTSVTEMNKNLLKASDRVKSKGKLQDVSLGTVHEMCRNLESWDIVHPKSMDPPGPVPTLTETSQDDLSDKNNEKN